MPDSSFLQSLLASADLASKSNSHAYAAGKILADLSAWLEAQGAADGLRVLEAAAADAGNWADVEGVIRKGARELLERENGKNQTSLLIKKSQN